jgi:hypothetical protein
MKTHTTHHRIKEPVNDLVEDTQALVSATTQLAEDKIAEALKRGRAVWKNAQAKTRAGMIGFILARRK